jgi:hypothetical protein
VDADRTLGLLDELAAADRSHEAALREVDGLSRETEAIHERADELARFLGSAPAAAESLEQALAEAEAQATVHAEALAQAEAELADAERRGDDERLAAARRAQVQAGDGLAVATKRIGSLRDERRELERRVRDAEREAPEVEDRARTIAESLQRLPHLAGPAGQAPPAGLQGVSAWATGARAALLVARSGLAVQREAVIRQVNELGSAVVGEPMMATSAEVIARRIRATVDAALRSS